MSKLFFSSLVTLSSLFFMIGVIVFLAMGFTDSYDTTILIFIFFSFNFISWLLSPMLMDIINYFLFKQNPISTDELKQKYPHVYEIIDQVSKEYNFKFPKFFIIDDMNPTAFTYGSGRFNARIVVSQGVFKYLNEKETKAVIAHELGHIVNRDFIVMMIATTLLEILYILYDVFARSREKKVSTSSSNSNSKGDPLLAIGYLSYLFYIIGTYLILYLSRTREYMADNFSATKTNAEDLANALIKLAYGIISEQDSNTSQRLLGATRALGVIDVQNSKQVGTTSYITNNNKDAVSDVMVFDNVSPWAMILEFSSTHPLTGKRIAALSEISKSTSKPFSYDIEGAIKRMKVDYNRLYGSFSLELLIISLPWIGAIFVFIFSLILGVKPLSLVFIFIGIALLIKTLYSFSSYQYEKTTILDCMRNVYASPLKGIAIKLEGVVIGRGVAGYVFNEDMMYQDKTGIMYLDYAAGVPLVGNLFFALAKLKSLINKPSEVTGWFFRGNFAHVTLNNYILKENNENIKSYGLGYSYLGGFIALLVGIILLFN